VSIELQQVCVQESGRDILREVSLRFERGEVCTLLGPNGAGKTTLLRCALGLRQPDSGQALVDGEQASVMNPRQRALKIAYLPQQRPLAWPISVRDLISLGRFAHGAAPRQLQDADAQAVQAAIDACDLRDLAMRRADQLSGGELARVHCARAIATRAPMLFADEPVAALDPLHQIQVMRLMRAQAEQGVGVVQVLHDVMLAARFSDKLVWLKDGRIVAQGTPAETITSQRMADVFGVQATIFDHDGNPQIAITGTAD
jgi:iron complex transport system ATP-binding protein